MSPTAKITCSTVHAASVGVGSSYASSSGVYLSGDSSGGGDGGGGGFLDAEGYTNGNSYLVSSVTKVKSSSSSGGGRRTQAAGSSGGLSPAFRERKVVSSRSGGYDGELFGLALSWCGFRSRVKEADGHKGEVF